MKVFGSMHGLKLAAAVVAALALGACAKIRPMWARSTRAAARAAAVGGRRGLGEPRFAAGFCGECRRPGVFRQRFD